MVTILGRIGQSRVQNVHILVAIVDEFFGIPCEFLQWNEDTQRIIPFIKFQSSTCNDYMNGSRNDSVHVPSVNEAHRYQSLL